MRKVVIVEAGFLVTPMAYVLRQDLELIGHSERYARKPSHCEPLCVLMWIKSSKAKNPNGLRSLYLWSNFSRKKPGSLTFSIRQLVFSAFNLGNFKLKNVLQSNALARSDFFLSFLGILRSQEIQ